jgi:hypothetical protein
MTSGEMQRISPEEDRAGARRARAHPCAFGTRVAGAPGETRRKMRSILGGSA